MIECEHAQLMTQSQAQLKEQSSVDAQGWQAKLDLKFEYDGQRSYLAFKEHLGPLRVQRPFYPEGREGACHVYLLHPPGGVVGGDALTICVDVAESAHALITTPAAGKFYRSASEFAVQSQAFNVASEAILEWLPQDNIFFSGAKVRMKTRVNLGVNARFIGWDISCFGRVPANEPFETGVFNGALEVWQDGQPLFIERACIDGGGDILQARWGMAGYSVVGSLICIGEYADLVDQVTAHVKEDVRLLSSDGLFTVTQVSGSLVCRYLGRHGEDAKAYFASALACIRPAALGEAFHRPRIWDT